MGLATLLGTLVALFGWLLPTLPALLATAVLGLAALLLPIGLRIFFEKPLPDRRTLPSARAVLLARALQLSRAVLPALGVASLAAFVTLLLALDQLARRWSPADEGARVIAVVEVDSLTRRSGLALEFDAAATIESPARLQRELRLRITWREPPAVPPRAGERWRLLLQVTAPRANSNPGGFDEQREFFRDRLQGRAVVLSSRLNGRLAAADGGLLVLRERLVRTVREAVVDRDAAALFAGLAVGATGEVSREQWRTFSITGTTHLVAISGMHVTLFCWLVAACARALWRGTPRLAARTDREIFAASLGVPAAFGYALLAGFGIPTQRTVVMLAVWWALRLVGRVHAPFDVLGIALVAVLVIDPFAALSSGFWLSFAAMAALILSGETTDGRATGASGGARGQRLARWLRDSLRTQWWVSLALVPLTLVWFSSLSLAGLIVNLVAIPVFSFVLVPVALAGSAVGALSPALARPLWWAGERVHELCWPALVAIAAQPWAAIEWSPIARLPWLRAERPAYGEVMITALEAGDGAAFIVRTKHHAIVYDTGEQFDSKGHAAERLVVPALRSFGVDHVDVLILSRTHAYRAAGAARLMHDIPVTRVAGGGDWPGAARPVDDCAATRRWLSDGVAFDTFGERGGSCVLRIGFADFGSDSGPHVLVAERVDTTEARALAERAGRGDIELASEIVVAPRRGSVAAVTPEFVKSVDPQYVLLGGRDPSILRQGRVAATWDVAPERVHVLATRGAVTVHLRAGLPPRWLPHTNLQRPPLWRYHPQPPSAR